MNPPRQNHNKGYDSDLSPPRMSKSKNYDPDLSPPRKSKSRNDDSDLSQTLDGKKAGLQDARALREETEAHKKREAEHFSKLSKKVTGVDQTAILQDSKTGRKRNLEAEAAEEREKQNRQTELNEKYTKWGKGLKQVEDREEKLKDDLYEMSKPLARYADDADLDRRLRDQEREGDPMLEYIKQKQIEEGKRKPDRPTYEGSFMPNRFGIKPGYRWDGVDRSNGYEKKWFEAQNAKTALQEVAYEWSTADM
nr:BUD13 homolog [Megalopta genalis]